jgi:hypothetical protein
LARNARETGRVMAVISLSMPIDYQLQEIKRLALAEDDDEEVPVPNPRPTKLARYRADQVPLHLRAIDARETYGVSFYEISKQLVSERPTLSVTYGQPGQYRSNAAKRLYKAAKNAQTQLATGAMLITHAAND